MPRSDRVRTLVAPYADTAADERGEVDRDRHVHLRRRLAGREGGGDVAGALRDRRRGAGAGVHEVDPGPAGDRARTDHDLAAPGPAERAVAERAHDPLDPRRIG